MLRKHIKDTNYAVEIKNQPPITGQCSCPQVGCQTADGSHPYRKGCVVYEEFGGGSGDYLTSLECKCCDGKGYLSSGERPYQRYCFAIGVRDLRTGYPEPYPMSRSLYDDPELIRCIQLEEQRKASENSSSDTGKCYVATAIYGSYDAEPVMILRRFRDEKLQPYRLGRLFIKTYYTLSPVLASITNKHQTIRIPVKKILDHIVNNLR